MFLYFQFCRSKLLNELNSSLLGFSFPSFLLWMSLDSINMKIFYFIVVEILHITIIIKNMIQFLFIIITSNSSFILNIIKYFEDLGSNIIFFRSIINILNIRIRYWFRFDSSSSSRSVSVVIIHSFLQLST